MKAIAPGKLILSGEHAAVYGRPALAMAIDRSAVSTIHAEPGNRVSIDLQDLNEKDSFTLRTLRDVKSRVFRNYQLFLQGDLGIREVLYKPIELFEYAFITVLDGLHLKLTDGLSIQTRSNIPIGCGMGSSAATILSTLRAVGHYFRVEFRPDWYYRYSMEVEKIQHGYPSGVDSFISLHGGCALFQNGAASSVPLPRSTLYLVNTGRPDTTTGECVQRVKQQFGEDTIWNDFEAVTLSMKEGFINRNDEVIRDAIRENHRLLTRLGVTPEPVQAFIREVEAQGGAAKTSGAGAVQGNQGGAVLVVADEPPVDLCKRHGYSMTALRGDPLGTRIIEE
ncbi:MAG: mevalonate kinase [Kiritimatiellae bacterium]|nr:mevalonate kinase [Kiritimatiellia bacterium]